MFSKSRRKRRIVSTADGRSPNTWRFPTIEAYVVLDRPRRSLTVYRADAGPHTFCTGMVLLGDVSLHLEALFA